MYGVILIVQIPMREPKSNLILKDKYLTSKDELPFAMTLLPFECIWEKNHIAVYQTNGTERFRHGIYGVITKQVCEKCGNPYMLRIKGKLECMESYLHTQIGDVDQIFQLGHYYKKNTIFKKEEEDVLSQDILELKRDPDYAGPIANAMFLIIKKNISMLLNADVIVPVPNHEDDYHADAKAVALASELQNEFHKDGKDIELMHALRKKVNISTTGLGREGREEMTKDMFTFDTQYSVSKKNVLLVDDILTAGNIKGRCASILKENGAKKVWVYVAGRTI